ncbi:MAG: flagellar basal body rod C-terminal domain-containing protein [Bacteroidota bacterium]
MISDRLSATFQTAAQGLALQRERIAAASQNIANARTTAGAGSGNGYKVKTVTANAPEPQQFVRLLSDSASALATSDSKHINPNTNFFDGNSKEGGLGPRFATEEQARYRYEYDPTHPDADENGMVAYPDVDMVQEMAEMVSANRLYEANLSSIEAEKEIIKRSLEI